MVSLILTLLLLAYLLIIPFRTGLLGRGRIETGRNFMDQLRKLHLLLAGLLFACWVLASWEIYLKGYWTTKVLGWCFFFSGIILYVLSQKQVSRKIERFYYGLYFCLPIAVIPICLFPIAGWMIYSTIYTHAMGTKTDIIYSDPHYRIQRVHIGNGFDATTALFVKKGLFEFRQEPEIISPDFIIDLDHISIQEISKDSLKIQKYFKGSFFPNNPYEMKIKLDN